MLRDSNEIISEILDLPDAPIVVEKLKKALNEEQKKRKHFYNVISEVKKSEFINGEIIVHSPVVLEHNETNLNIFKIVDAFVITNDLGFVGVEKILIKFDRNDYEPDLCFFKKEVSKKFKQGKMFFPPPNFIVEITSKSTEKRDRGIKFKDYQAHKVEEYWLVNAQNKTVEQYHLKNGKYELLLKSNSGEIKCIVLKGLTIPIKTIFNKKLAHQFAKTL